MQKPLTKLQRQVVNAAVEKKAFNILILDVRAHSDLTDFFVICSGNSKVQVQAIVDGILEKTHKTRHKPAQIEGYSGGSWVIVDLVDIIVHVFHKDVRSHYDLERLWGDVPVIDAAAR